MAYNFYPTNYPYQQNFYPATYQPVQYPQQYQTQVQPVQQTAQNGIIWVNSGVEAQAYPVAPNNAVTLWSTAEPVVYLKKTDASGKPTLVTYDLVERKDPSVRQDEKQENYATAADLSAVANTLTELRTDIETLKSDVYGLSGKRRKKSDDDE